MPASGSFIVLFDRKTLELYLARGVYGFLMSPVRGKVSSRSRHFHALADYASARNDTHIFFFTRRTIVYGGQISGPADYGAFHLNGMDSPLGLMARAPICWDESARYKASDEPGIFEVDDLGPKCQPYLFRFDDKLGLKGRYILSDQLYTELGSFPYPLPTNSIQGMGFCTMTPAETETALDLLENDSIGEYKCESDEPASLSCEPVAFEPHFGVSNLEEAFEHLQFVNEAHLEASILANPFLLPEELRPSSATICRQVPISPLKPYQMDRADICYYSDEGLRSGTIPDVVIELKWGRAGKASVEQVHRYVRWLSKILGSDASRVRFFLVAPSFTRGLDVPQAISDQLTFVSIG